MPNESKGATRTSGNASNPDAPHPTAGRPLRYHQKNVRARLVAREKVLNALRQGYTVSKACEMAALPIPTASAWRKSDPEFAEEWSRAYETGTDVFEDEAMRRAVHGYPGRPVVISGGQGQPSTILDMVEYSDTLLVTMLKARRPDKFRERTSTELTGPNGGPVKSVNVNLTGDQFIEIAKKITSEI